jgi:hypothetical protein
MGGAHVSNTAVEQLYQDMTEVMRRAKAMGHDPVAAARQRYPDAHSSACSQAQLRLYKQEKAEFEASLERTADRTIDGEYVVDVTASDADTITAAPTLPCVSAIPGSGPMTDLSDIATRANMAHDNACEAAAQAVAYAIEAGRALIDAKDIVGHGDWLEWLKDNVTFSDRTARLYMRLAEVVPAMSDEDRQRVAKMSLRGAAKAIASKNSKKSADNKRVAETARAARIDDDTARSWGVVAIDDDGKRWTNGVRVAEKKAVNLCMGNALHAFRDETSTITEVRAIASDEEPNVYVETIKTGKRKGRLGNNLIFQDGQCHLFGWQEVVDSGGAVNPISDIAKPPSDDGLDIPPLLIRDSGARAKAAQAAVEQAILAIGALAVAEMVVARLAPHERFGLAERVLTAPRGSAG